MTPLRHCCACLLTGLGLGLIAHAQELPSKSGPEDLEAEAKKLMEDLPALDKEADGVSPLDPLLPVPAPNEDAAMAVERTKVTLERLRKKQQRWEKLAKQGVLSRAEAEGCVVEVAEAVANHEQARVTLLRAQLKSAQERVANGTADQSLVESAGAALQTAIELSSSAEKQRFQTRLEAARTNLDRHRKLFAAGLVSRVQLQRAEASLQKVEASGLKAEVQMTSVGSTPKSE